jgi:DNA-binding LacI/PurR family transcriptional regulator
VSERTPGRAAGSAKRPTIVDVARAAGVSKSLVSLVMQGSPLVRDEKRARVMAAAQELGYRMNSAARSLSVQRSGTVGVLVSDLRNPALIDIVDLASEQLQTAGLSPLLTTGLLPTSRRTQAPHLDVVSVGRLKDLRVEGVLVVGSVPDRAAFAELLGDLPVVTASAQAEGLPGDAVRTDDVTGMRLVVDHLVERGHRRIAHLGGRGGAVAADRLSGYVDAMQAHGLEENCVIADADFTEAAGYRGAGELLGNAEPTAGPTALVAVNDLAAIGAMSAAFDRGLAVPTNLAVTGYDNSFIAAIRHVSLTSVNPNTDGIASLAVRRLVERIGGDTSAPADHLLPPTLVVRGSSSAPNPAGRSGRHDWS